MGSLYGLLLAVVSGSLNPNPHIIISDLNPTQCMRGGVSRTGAKALIPYSRPDPEISQIFKFSNLIDFQIVHDSQYLIL